MVLDTEQIGDGSWRAFQDNARTEVELSERTLTEIKSMLDQIQGEVNKLAQRNTAITVHLQQIQSQIDSLPRADIRMAYDAALDAQQRLFVMRGQMEKLQSDQTHLTKYIRVLKQILEYSDVVKPAEERKAESSTASVEMLINAQEGERQRLSRQMHDGPAQALSNFILQTEIAMRLFDIDQSRAKDELVNLKTSAMSTFQKVRNFIFELRPMMLDDLGLIPTVKRYTDTFKEQTQLDLSLQITGQEKRLEPYIEVLIFRALQELLGNAARHSQCTHIKEMINLEEEVVRVSVDDDGKGFDPAVIHNSGCLGLRLIKERVEMLGGEVIFDSVIGKGTRISLVVPTINRTDSD